MKVAEFRTSLSGKQVPYVMDEAGALVPVADAPLSHAQEAFLCAPEREVIGVGNRGGGKTKILIMDFLSGVGRGWGTDYSGILFRESQPQLRDVIKEALALIKSIWPNAKYNALTHTVLFPQKETLEFFHFERPDDFVNLQGRQFVWIAFEELCNSTSLEGYLKMFSCLRSTGNPAMPRKVRATANPLGDSHNAIKYRFRLHGVPQGVCGPAIIDSIGEDGKPEWPRRAIHFNFEDNIILRRNEPDYMKSIVASCAGNAPQLDAWQHGNWDIVAGGALDAIFFEHGNTILIDRFVIPESWPMFMSLDYGSTDPFSLGFYAVSDGSDIKFFDGSKMSTKPDDLFRVGEIYGAHPGKWDAGLGWTVPQIVTAAYQYKIDRGWRHRHPVSGKWIDGCRKGVADSTIFDNLNNEFTIADLFEEPVILNGERIKGIRWEATTSQTPNSRATGLQKLCEKLIATQRPRERSALFIVKDDCPAACATLPVLPRDKNHPSKVASVACDHVYDEIRFALHYDVHSAVIWSGRIDQLGKRRA